MKSRFSKLSVLLMLFTVLSASSAHAGAYDSMEYITYGGFEVITWALFAVARLMSSSAFKGLYVAVGVIGAFYLVMKLGTNAVTGSSDIDMWEWARMYWWGIFFMGLLIIPKGELTVYDRIKNRSQIIGDLPVGIVWAAGFTNQIEIGLREMVETAISPIIPLEFAANGVGFDMFSNLYSFSSHMKWDNEYDRVNLDQYIEDCWRYAVVMGDVKPEDIQKNTDWMALLKEGTFSLFYTVERTDANPKGTTVTCTAMYNNYIKQKFNNAYFEERLKSFCRTLGRDPGNAAEYQSCKDMISNHLTSIVGVNVDPEVMIMQTAIGERIDASLRSGDMADAAEVIGARDTGTAMVGAGLMANQFIPIFRNVIIAITIIMSPIIFLFFSIYGPNAFKYWIGGFIWAATWGVTDTIIDRFAQNYAYDIFAQIRDYQLGLGSLLLFDKESVRVLAVLGNMKTVAAVISMSLVEGIMGQVNASGGKIAGDLQNKMEGAGQSAGHTALTPEGSGSKIKDLESKLSVMANARDYSFSDRVQAGTYDTGVGTQRSLNNVNEFGGTGRAIKAVAGGTSRSDQAGAYANEGLTQMGIVPGREGGAQAVEKGISVKTTEKAVAGMGSPEAFMDGKSSADSLKAQEDIKKSNEFYEGLQRTMSFDTPDQAAQYHGEYLGAESAAQAEGKLKSGANRISDRDLSVSSGSHGKFEDMLNSSSSTGELKSKVDTSGDKDLNKLFSNYTKGNDNADIGAVKKEFSNEQHMNSAGLAQRMGYAYAANQLGDMDSVYRNTAAMGLGNNVEGMRRHASFLKNGALTKEMAQSGNKALGFEDDKGPLKEGMKADSWGATDDGKFMVTKASYQDGSGSIEIGDGKVTEQGAFRNKGEAMAEADRLKKDGHISAGTGLENMANSILPGEAISYSRTKSFKGEDIASSYTHGSESQHYDLASEKEGAQLQNKDTANVVLDKHSADLVNQVAKAKNWDTRFNAGDEVNISGARAAYDWKNLGQVKSLDPNKISSITGGTGAHRNEEDMTTIKTGKSEVHEDVKKDVTDHGFELNNAMWMAMAGDSAFAKHISEPSKDFDANLAKVVDATMNDVRDFYKREGSSTGYAVGSVSGGTGIGIPGTKTGVSMNGEVGRRSEDREHFDLTRAELDQNLRKAASEAWAKGMNKQDTEKHITTTAGNYLREEIYNKGRNASPTSFGGDAPLTALQGGGGRNHMEVTDDMAKKNPSLKSLQK